MSLNRDAIASGGFSNPYASAITNTLGFGFSVADTINDSNKGYGYEVNSSPSLYNDNLSLDTGWYRNHINNSEKVMDSRRGVGASYAGKLAGSGAGAGAAIGTMIMPGVGTAIGGAVGAGYGALTGILLGKHKRKKLKRAAREIQDSSNEELGSYLGEYNSKLESNAYRDSALDRYYEGMKRYNPDSIYL